MDLALDLTRTSGRAAKPVSAEIVRELNAADMALLSIEKGVKPTAIKRLRDSHHGLARLVAQGLPGVEISAITGYSQSRISILKSDPAFAELVAFYKSNLEELRSEAQADFFIKAVAARNDFLEELHDRVLDTPELLSTDQVNDSVKMLANLTGYGVSNKSTNVNVNIGLAEQVAAGRQRAERLSAEPSATNPTTIDAPVIVVGEGGQNE